MRHLPFGIAGARHGLRLRVLAPQRGLRCMGEGLCMGLSSAFLLTPTPSGCRRDGADHSLPALVDSHVLHRDLLLTAGSVPLQRLHLSREGAGELVEGALGAVLLGDVLDMV